jgi:hypothetical protein
MCIEFTSCVRDAVGDRDTVIRNNEKEELEL